MKNVSSKSPFRFLGVGLILASMISAGAAFAQQDAAVGSPVNCADLKVGGTYEFKVDMMFEHPLVQPLNLNALLPAFNSYLEFKLTDLGNGKVGFQYLNLTPFGRADLVESGSPTAQADLREFEEGMAAMAKVGFTWGSDPIFGCKLDAPPEFETTLFYDSKSTHLYSIYQQPRGPSLVEVIMTRKN